MTASTQPTRDKQSEKAIIRKMADLLRAGAALLAERCPLCGLPLFRLKSGEIICPVHGRVFIVKTEAEVTRASVQGVLEELEKTIAAKISEALKVMSRAEADDDSIVRRLITWLDALERVERILSMVRGVEVKPKEGAKKS